MESNEETRNMKVLEALVEKMGYRLTLIEETEEKESAKSPEVAAQAAAPATSPSPLPACPATGNDPKNQVVENSEKTAEKAPEEVAKDSEAATPEESQPKMFGKDFEQYDRQTKETLPESFLKRTEEGIEDWEKLMLDGEGKVLKAHNRPTQDAAKYELDEYHEYIRDTKRSAKKLERNNFKEIILFDSGAPWYKMAFNSALIYEFQVTPHLAENPFRIRADSDGYATSNVGVVGVNDVLRFAEIMVKIGASIPISLRKYFNENGERPDTGVKLPTKERERFYIFEIDKMSRAKFDTYLKAKRKKEKDLNELVLPAYVPRELYPDLHLFAAEIAKACVRLPHNIYEIYGKQMAQVSITMLRHINLSCNGYYGGKEGFHRALARTVEGCAEIQEALRVLLDSNVLTYGRCQELALLAIKVQQDALIEQGWLNDETESQYVKAIKEMKNFQRIREMDLSESLPRKSEGQNGYIETKGEEDEE